MSRWLDRCLSCSCLASSSASSHVVEKHLRDALAVLRSGTDQRGMSVPVVVRLEPRRLLERPHLLVGATLVETVVDDAQQPSLFEVGRRQPPPAHLIAIYAVRDDLAQHLIGLLARWPAEIRVCGVVFRV